MPYSEDNGLCTAETAVLTVCIDKPYRKEEGQNTEAKP